MSVYELYQETFEDSDLSLPEIAELADRIYNDGDLQKLLQGEIHERLKNRHPELDDVAAEAFAEGMAREAIGHAFVTRGGTLTVAALDVEIEQGDRIIRDGEDKTAEYRVTSTPDPADRTIPVYNMTDDRASTPMSVGHVVYDPRYSVKKGR